MPPPLPDDHNEQARAWREYALQLQAEAARDIARLQAQLATQEAQIEALKRMVARRNEARRKMPKPAPPPRTPEESLEHRRNQQEVRIDNVETIDEPPTPVPESEKRCPECGGTEFRDVGIGKPSEVWSYVAAHIRRHVHSRQVCACRCGAHVVTAPAPERWSDKTRYDASFVAHLVVSKCLMSTPLYRLEAEYKRVGVPLARSTMNDLFRRCAKKLEPLRAPLFDAIREDEIVHADETRFKLTTQTSRAFLWVFLGRKLTGYEFALSRGGEVASDVLKDSRGVLVCDDYSGYDAVVKQGSRERAGCMAHARRYFFEANKDGSRDATRALDLIGVMYAVEHEADRRAALGADDRLALRRQFSRGLFAELLQLSRRIARAAAPKELLGKAARYTLTNRMYLRRALTDARIPLDNNRAENAMRIVALGRKNFLFVQSEDAGKELALLYSLVVSCDKLGKNPLAYLTDVLRRLDATPKSALRELLPDRWQPPEKPTPPGEPIAAD